jgi:hypothetical protein
MGASVSKRQSLPRLFLAGIIIVVAARSIVKAGVKCA